MKTTAYTNSPTGCQEQRRPEVTAALDSLDTKIGQLREQIDCLCQRLARVRNSLPAPPLVCNSKTPQRDYGSPLAAEIDKFSVLIGLMREDLVKLQDELEI